MNILVKRKVLYQSFLMGRKDPGKSFLMKRKVFMDEMLLELKIDGEMITLDSYLRTGISI